MPILGTKYQTFEWERIKKILTNAGVKVIDELEEANNLLRYAPSQWLTALQSELGKSYKTSVISNEYNDLVSLAIELTDILNTQTQRTERLFNTLILQSKDKKDNAEVKFKSIRYKTLSDYFSELHYIKDAENIAISTGKIVSAQHVQVLAKVEQLNREIEKIFADGDICTLAELTGEDFYELETNPFLINKYKQEASRPKLIMAVDKVYRARKNKKPQLPTNKYNNLVNPSIIAQLLNELVSAEEITIVAINIAEGKEYDWLDTFVTTVNQVEESVEQQYEEREDSNSFWSSPSTNDTEQTELDTQEANNACLAVIEPTLKLGLILKMDKNNDMLDLLSAEDLTILQGKKLNKSSLAKLYGNSVYKFEIVIEKTLQDYIHCMQKSIPLLSAREL